MVMNCFSSKTILLFHRRKIFSGVCRPFQIIRKQGSPECISPQRIVEDTPKSFPIVVRFELKTAFTLLPTEEKRWATFDSRLRLSIEKAGRAFENRFGKGNLDEENWFSEADSPLEIQISLAFYLSKTISKPIPLSEIAQSSWQRTLRGRCNYLNLWGQRDRSEMILQSKIQNNSSFRIRKTILTGAIARKITADLVTLLRKTEVWSWFDIGFLFSHVGIIVEIWASESNLNVITSLSDEATLIFLVAEVVGFFSKSRVWSSFVSMILFYISGIIVC